MNKHFDSYFSQGNAQSVHSLWKTELLFKSINQYFSYNIFIAVHCYANYFECQNKFRLKLINKPNFNQELLNVKLGDISICI